MGQEPSLEEYRAGARIFSVAAAAAAVGFVVAPQVGWRYLCAGIAVVCFVRSVIYYRKGRGE